MATKESPFFSEQLVKSIEKAIGESLKNLISDRFESVRKDFNDKLEREKDQVIAGIAINVMKYLQVETMNDHIIIKVNKSLESKA